MRVIWGTETVLRQPTCVALGVFDGVHIGHRQVIGAALSQARAGNLRAAVLTFDPHPDAVVNPHGAPPLLTTTAEKLAIFRKLGVKVTVVARFDTTLAQMLAEDFINHILAGRLQARRVTVGENWRFGAHGRGSTETLEQMGRQLGFGVTRVPPVLAAGGPVSSTRVRQLLLAGDVTSASRLLGRYYSVKGHVVAGDGIGRTLGFPTANIHLQEGKLLPADGIYAGLARAGRAWPAVVYIGKRPTLEGRGEQRFEVHLLRRIGPVGRPGSQLEIELVSRLRGDQQFASLKALKAQMVHDCEQAQAVLR